MVSDKIKNPARPLKIESPCVASVFVLKRCTEKPMVVEVCGLLVFKASADLCGSRRTVRNEDF